MTFDLRKERTLENYESNEDMAPRLRRLFALIRLVVVVVLFLPRRDLKMAS